MPNALAILSTTWKDGLVLSVSILYIVDTVISTFFAKESWLILAFSLASLILFPSDILLVL